MNPRTTAIVSAVIPMLLVVADCAWADTPSERLRAFFREANAIIQTVDSEQGMEESRAAMRALVNDVFDFREASALALGREWRVRTSAEQDEFVRLFTDLLERGYVAMVGSKARVSGGLSITFTGEAVQDDVATVTTTILTRSGDELPIDYHMLRRGGRWAVRDVLVDGVSLVGNYRAQFHRVIQAWTYAGLVAQMRGKMLASPPPVAGTLSTQSTPVRRVAATAPVVDAPKAPAVHSAEPTAAPGPPSTAPPAVVSPSPQTVPSIVTEGSAAPALIQPPPVATAIVPVAPVPTPASGPARVTQQRVAPRDPAPPSERRKQVALTKNEAGIKTTVAQRAQYWIQLGAFKTVDAASRLARELRGQLASVSTAGPRVTTQPSDSFSRVRVGPFAERSQAAARLKAFEGKGYHGFVVAEARE